MKNTLVCPRCKGFVDSNGMCDVDKLRIPAFHCVNCGWYGFLKEESKQAVMAAVALMALVLFAVPAFAQTSPIGQPCPGTGNIALTHKSYIQSSVLSGAFAFTVPTGSMIAIVSVESNGVRYRTDGTLPTATVGMPIASGSSVILCGLDILTNFTVISQAGTATVNMDFYGR